MGSGSYFEIKGKKIFYIDSGEGSKKKTVLLLHGYSFSSADWVNIGAIEQFSSMGYRVILLDYPGFGKSEPLDEYRIREGQILNAGKFICTFLDHAGVKSCTAIGPSMGGGILIDSWSFCSDRLNSMILVAPAWFHQSNLSDITCNKLFVWGDMDDIIPLNGVESIIKSLKNSNLEVIRGGKHAVYLNKPQEFFSVCRKYMA